MSFFFRYGGVDTGRNQIIEASTKLYRSTTLNCDGGEADFQPVNQLESCVKLFGICYTRLINQMKIENDEGTSTSLLGTIVHPGKLKEERQRCLEKASWSEKQRKATIMNYPGKPLVRNPFTFTKGKSTVGSITVQPKKYTASKKRSFSELVKDKDSTIQPETKNDESELVKDKAKTHRYDLRPRGASPIKERGKRSKRGALIPKERPDLEAKRAQSDTEKILSRGMKRRKNKKKQKRDEALTAFVFSNV